MTANPFTRARLAVEAARARRLDRADVIDALSWAEDPEHGRWGTEYATAVLDAHDARVHADLLAELEQVRTYAALSWPSDTEDGRWGTKYAAAVLDAHDAQVHTALRAENTALLAEVEDLRAYAATAHGPESWTSAMTEMQRLRDELAAIRRAAPAVNMDGMSTAGIGEFDVVRAQHNSNVAGPHRNGPA